MQCERNLFTAYWQTRYKMWHLLRVYLKQDIAGTEHNLKGDLLTALQELTTLVRQEHAKVALRARQVRKRTSLFHCQT